MSEYTREEILKMIEENGGPENVDLSGKNLSGIDLSKEAMAKELEKYQQEHPGKTPVWFWEKTGGINLGGATLKKTDLSWAHLEGAILIGTHLEEADLSWAHLERTWLWSAHLDGADLEFAHLDEAVLRLTHLEGAILRGTHLESAFIQGASFKGANLSETHLEKADLYSVASLAGAYFERAFLEQTRLRKEDLGSDIGEEVDKEYYEAKEAYLLLKNNFNQIGRYDDASWAYRKERRMERMTHGPDLAPKFYDYPKLPDPLPTGAKGILHRLWLLFRKARFHLSHLRNYQFDTAQLLLCDFGENPWLVLIWAAVALFVFGLAYIGFGGLGPAPGASSVVEVGDHFVYSLFAFATMDHPRIVATTGLAQFLTGFEALVGIFMAAIFVFTLGNRISRS